MASARANAATHRDRPAILWLVVFAAAYLAGAWLGRWLMLVPNGGATLWPPSGLYLAVLAATPPRRWLWWLAAALPADLLASTGLFAFPLPAALGVYGANTLEALVGAALLQRLCDPPFRLRGLRDILALALCGSVACAAGATLGAATLAAFDRGTFPGSWPLWWIGDTTAVMVIAPLVLCALELRGTSLALRPSRVLEACAVFATLLALAAYVFSGHFPFAFLLLPPALWAAVRFGLLGAAATSGLLAVLTVRYTAAGKGMFAALAETLPERQWHVQLFLLIISISALLTAALIRQRGLALERLARANEELERRVAERTQELERSEQRLQLANARFVAALHAAPVVAFTQDLDLRYTWIHNPALGYEPESVVGKTDYDLFERRADADRLIAVKREVLQSGHAQRTEVEIQHGGMPRYFDLCVQPQADPSGSPTGVVCTAVDITDRRRAQDQIRQSEARFRRIFMHAATGMAISDHAGRFAQCNPAYCSLLGYTEEELRRLDFPCLVHPEDRAENLAAVECLQRRQIPHFEIENRYVHKDGHAVWVRKFVSQLPSSDDQPPRLLSLVTDITERRTREQALRESDRLKDEFLAVLAHELRNPLAPIRSAVELLELAGDNAALTAQAHEVIERQVDLLVRLVDDLLDVSRISRGKIELRRKRIDLRDVLEDAIENSRPFLAAAGHELVTTLPAPGIVVDADSARLAQVLTNLLHNAAKYTPAGGRIELEARAEHGEAVVCVRDTGVGIAADELARIFDMFAQVEANRDQAQGGLGIGLTLVRRLVELHGGRVHAESSGTNRGSSFTIHLPLAAALEAPALPRAPEELASAPPGRRVLVVDDNVDAAETLSTLLRLMGSEVRTAYDGPAALEVARAFKPELALLDIRMPHMDGYEVARRLLQEDATLVVAAVTGFGQEHDRARTRAAGFADHLTKPVDAKSLRQLLGSERAA